MWVTCRQPTHGTCLKCAMSNPSSFLVPPLTSKPASREVLCFEPSRPARKCGARTEIQEALRMGIVNSGFRRRRLAVLSLGSTECRVLLCQETFWRHSSI